MRQPMTFSRRGAIGGALSTLAVAACGRSDSYEAEPLDDGPMENPWSVRDNYGDFGAASGEPIHVQAPTKTKSGLPAWVLEGDSYMMAPDIPSLSQFIGPALGEPTANFAVKGSTFQMIADRILAKPELRENPLLIWDGSCNGHVDGSIELEMKIVAAIAAYKEGRKNWLIIPPVVVQGRAHDIERQVDMLRYREALIQTYGRVHMFDALPVINSLAAGPRDELAIAGGFVPRSQTGRGVHLRASALTAVADALTARNGPMAKVRNL